MPNQFFPPCILLVATAACLAIIGLWSFYFVQGPDGAAFTPAPPTMSPSPAPPPAPTAILALGATACSAQVCEAQPVTMCNATSVNAFCIVDDLRPICTLGLCATNDNCVPTEDLVTLTFACSCTCQHRAL